jgi:hypothetical protein
MLPEPRLDLTERHRAGHVDRSRRRWRIPVDENPEIIRQLRRHAALACLETCQGVSPPSTSEHTAATTRKNQCILTGFRGADGAAAPAQASAVAVSMRTDRSSSN